MTLSLGVNEVYEGISTMIQFFFRAILRIWMSPNMNVTINASTTLVNIK